MADKNKAKSNITINKARQMYVGQVFKNYRELCLLFGDKVSSGKQKSAQLKEWARYFDHKREGNKYIITEIYEYPLDKFDNRSLMSGGSEYSEDLQKLILSLINHKRLSMNDRDRSIIIMRSGDLMKELGVINVNYTSIKQYSSSAEELLGIERDFIDEFMSLTDDNLKSAIESAMNRLKRRRLIDWSYCRVASFKDEDNIRSFTTREMECVLQSEYEVLNEIGCKDIIEVFLKKKTKEFYNKVNYILANEYNINVNFYYYAYEIVFTKLGIENAFNVLPDDEKKSIMKKLNSNVQNRLYINAEKRQKKSFEKYEEAKTVDTQTPDCERNLVISNLMSSRDLLRVRDNYLDNTKDMINVAIEPNAINITSQLLKTHKDIIKKCK